MLPARWQLWGTSSAANPNLGNDRFAGCPLEGQGWVLVHGMMGMGSGTAAKREVAAGSDSHIFKPAIISVCVRQCLVLHFC